MSDEISEEIAVEYLLAKNLLVEGIAARRDWKEAVSAIEEQYEEALEIRGLYNVLKAMEVLVGLPIRKYFADNGFAFDENLKSLITYSKSEIGQFIDRIIDKYVSNMYCKDVEHVATFRNHNTKMQIMLFDLCLSKLSNMI